MNINSDKHKLLNKWMYQTILDHPDMVKDAHSVIDIYRGLQHVFIQDIQLCLKEMAEEILKPEKN